MKCSIEYIINKPNDFKVCKKCFKINWYENLQCISCFHDSFTQFNLEIMDFKNNSIPDLNV